LSEQSISDVYDIAVIGAGPGGYTAAIRAAQLKAKVILVEETKIGGICSNVGCIPTKTLLNSLELMSEVKKAEALGLSVGNFRVDLSSLMRRKDEAVSRLIQGIEFLLRSNGVSILFGRGTITLDKRVEITQRDGGRKVIGARKIILATGSQPARLPIPMQESENVLSHEDALDFSNVPPRLAIAGGGSEGIEFACIYSKLGSQVIVLETMPHILPREDPEIAQYLQRKIVRDGIEVKTNAEITSVKDLAAHQIIQARINGQEETVEAEKMLVSLKRTPRFENLGLEELGVRILDGRIVVDEKMETTVADVYAVGDVIGGAYAHEAMEGGIVAAENAVKKESDLRMDWSVIPRCLFTMPQVAAVGLTEEEAEKRGVNVRIGRFHFAANARALTMNDTEGLVKMVTDAESQEILGVHIVGPNASEIIAEAALAMKLEATPKDIAETMHAHPTLSEALREAAMDVDGYSIHKFKKHS
jgi:dihydrolipoamide dehydrogenase